VDPVRFERIAARFEQRFRSSPGRYRLLILALGVLGYAVVGAVVLLSLVLLALTLGAMVLGKSVVMLKVAIPLGLTTWALLRAVWVKLERPTGQRLDPARSPALFAEIERIRRIGDVPRIHRVLVDGSFNAGVAQVPRLGVLGWPHNDLVLGLPLLLSLTPEHFRAVLAHELGHLSGRHGRSGAWVYRIRATWLQVLGALEQRQSRLAKLLGPFFRWYGPYFSAASLALAREHEREADRFAASVTDARTAAGALAAVAVADWALDQRFWPALDRRTGTEPQAPMGFLGELGPAVRAALAEPGAEAALARALRLRAMGSDTHPSLAERIAALGETARRPAPPTMTAAERFLGAALPGLRAALDAEWREGIAERWAQLHAERAGDRERLAALEAAAAERVLDADETWEQVALTERLAGAEAAFPMAQAAAERHPEHAPSRFGLGRLLLRDGREEGLAHVERAMALDRDAELVGAQLIASFHVAQGRNEAAGPWIQRAVALEAVHQAAQAERSSMVATDPVEPHGLAPEQVEVAVGALRRHPRVKRLYLARKALRHLTDRAPAFVVAVVPRRAWWKTWSDAKATALATELVGLLEGGPTVFLFVEGPGTAVLFRRVKKVAQDLAERRS